jgi:hypothetical protein
MKMCKITKTTALLKPQFVGKHESELSLEAYGTIFELFHPL